MMGGKGKHGPMGEGPMHGFLRHLINKKMKKAHKKLQRRCAEEMSECPQKRGPGLIDCLLSKQQRYNEKPP